MHMLQSLFYLTTALHVSGITITHLQEHKTTVTTASGNHYTVIDRVKFTDLSRRAACGCSPAEIVGSKNPTGSMDICLLSVVCCQVEVSATS